MYLFPLFVCVSASRYPQRLIIWNLFACQMCVANHFLSFQWANEQLETSLTELPSVVIGGRQAGHASLVHAKAPWRLLRVDVRVQYLLTQLITLDREVREPTFRRRARLVTTYELWLMARRLRCRGNTWKTRLLPRVLDRIPITWLIWKWAMESHQKVHTSQFRAR